uniref:Uncharacterized protein n=1 Tax=Meloidogyne incognita TaxID=6306 RepID=A0A914NMF0_MELIC
MRREIIEPGYDYELFSKGATNRAIYRVLVIEEPGYDYELFSKGATNRAIYRVLVIDDRFPSGHPNFAELQYLTESPNYSNNEEQKINNFVNYLPPLLVASGSPNCLRFIQVQKGDPLNICLPQNDFTEFNNLL